jgi:hypothetical protein
VYSECVIKGGLPPWRKGSIRSRKKAGVDEKRSWNITGSWVPEPPILTTDLTKRPDASCVA